MYKQEENAKVREGAVPMGIASQRCAVLCGVLNKLIIQMKPNRGAKHTGAARPRGWCT
jgi:hypothetical protein